MKKVIWVFPAAVLVLILLLNLQGRENSMALSNRVEELLAAMLGDEWFRANVRRLGHTAEYFLLGFACCWGLGWRGLPFTAGCRCWTSASRS